MELTSDVVDPMERRVAHVDVAGVSSRVSDAQTPEEHLFPQQSVQSVKKGAMRIHPTKKHRAACSNGGQEELAAVVDECRWNHKAQSASEGWSLRCFGWSASPHLGWMEADCCITTQFVKTVLVHRTPNGGHAHAASRMAYLSR